MTIPLIDDPARFSTYIAYSGLRIKETEDTSVYILQRHVIKIIQGELVEQDFDVLADSCGYKKFRFAEVLPEVPELAKDVLEEALKRYDDISFTAFWTYLCKACLNG